MLQDVIVDKITGGIMEQLILASASPRRTELLNQAGIPHRVVSGNVDESTVPLNGNPAENVVRLAVLKAMSVAEKCDRGLVLGADTVVVLDGTIFGKPADSRDAFEMLSRLSGREHSVITGIAIVDAASSEIRTSYEETKVKFKNLSDELIHAYIKTGEPFDKAGAYAVQGRGALLVEKITGSYDNVVGLPLNKVAELLEEFGINVSTVWEDGLIRVSSK